MSRADSYQLLIQKLDQFIRKYYINQIIRGSIYFLALVLVLFLTFTLLEGNFHFGMGARKAMFFSFLIGSAAALGIWVVRPLLSYFQLGQMISREQAAGIIGDHFVDVKDKLLNILQLQNRAGAGVENEALIMASVEQKASSIRLVPFKNAIDLSKNRKYLRYALPPLLLLLVLLVAAPSLITDSTNRIIRNNEEFERPAPFTFVLAEEDPSVVQYGDYQLIVETEGDVLPNDVLIQVGKIQYRMQKEEANRFTYQFKNVQESTDFSLTAGAVQSKDYELKVLLRPNLGSFSTALDYPAYTQRKDETLQNIGDLVVPVGTNIDWVFDAEHTDQIDLLFARDLQRTSANRDGNEVFSFNRKALKDESYKLYISNENLADADSIYYTLTVIPDQYPAIKAQEFVDSLNSDLIYFLGETTDDYGLVNLSFNFRVRAADGTEQPMERVDLGVKKGTKQMEYRHVWDLRELTLTPGDQVTYYFEVFDNDGVNGSKSARTGLQVYKVPTLEELEQQEEENDQEIIDRLQKAIEENKKVQQDLKKLREKLLQEKEMDWQDRKELEKLLERQKELQKEINKAKEAFEENQKNQEKFQQAEENIQEKQEQLQKLFDDATNKEMEELMEKIQELMEELQKDEALEMMEQMEYQDQEMEMDMERLEELFKQLELEAEMERTMEKLEELAEQQEELSKKTEESKEGENQEELEKEQEEINEEFEKIEEKMDEMQKKNEELERPKDLDPKKEEREDIKKDLNESQEQIQQQQNKKASQKQKEAAQKMREMAESMGSQMQSGSMEQMQEDMAALRQLLENLVGLSFEQEDLIDRFAEASENTPRYVDLVQQQFKLDDDFRLIEDSLVALSKRVFQIESFVTEKITDINEAFDKSVDELEERRKGPASVQQQTIMKNVNDLALMLSEVMNQMQQQMSSMMSGSQMCNKPGGQGNSGKVPQDKISKGQEKLNGDMQKMKEGMQKGEGGTSKEFAEMAARQAALRKALREKQKKLQEQGKGSKELEGILDQMNKMEKDLVNKRLTNEMMKRQEEILTRLLEAERAERERQYDNKRKSETADQFEREVPPSLEEYLKKRESEVEPYQSVSPSLKPYYKQLVDEYFKTLKNGE